MSSFSGFPSESSQTIVKNDGFWPDLALADFQALYRLPRDYTDALLADHVGLAMLWANRQLEAWKAEKVVAGYATLADVPAALQGGSLGQDTASLLFYRRAVFCHAKALLLPQFATINRREAAKNEAKESPEYRENFLASAEQAIADLLGHGRVDVELI
ncbi:MAG: head completion/stabilization protein [Desulfovibrio sp.]|uniref:head completion/stabilization protein n=1 Tax=Desulfovibrio sp. 7SRBS1 TaxID=3378064 RepID=UPI003B3DB5CA